MEKEEEDEEDEDEEEEEEEEEELPMVSVLCVNGCSVSAYRLTASFLVGRSHRSSVWLITWRGAAST